MSRSTLWSRRHFVQLVGSTALASQARGLAGLAFSSSKEALSEGTAVFVARGQRQGGSIEVFIQRRGQLQSIQTIATEQPTALTLSQDQKALYVVNETAQHLGLPRGTVESYRIEPQGQLTLLNCQPLSLAATMPSHAALAPDGGSLVVTARGGAILNHLPILADGSLAQVNGIYKFTGAAEGRAAQPGPTVFDAASRMINLDAGTGTLRILHREDAALALHHSHTIIETGHHLAIGHDSRSLYMTTATGLEHYAYDRSTGAVLGIRQRFAMKASSLSMHPSGRLLVAGHDAGNISAWKITANGEMLPAGTVLSDEHADHLTFSPEGYHLLALSKTTGRITAASIEPTSGLGDRLQLLATVDSPRSMVTLSL